MFHNNAIKIKTRIDPKIEIIKTPKHWNLFIYFTTLGPMGNKHRLETF